MKIKLALALWLTLCAPAFAKPNQQLGVAWPYARSLGIQQGEFSLEPSARVVTETWFAPDSGWTFDKAKSLANLIMNAKKPTRIHKPTSEITVLNYPSGAVALKLENNKISSLTAFANDWDEDKEYLTFAYKLRGPFLYVNDKLHITLAMFDRLFIGMTHSEVVRQLDGEYGEQTSSAQIGDTNLSSYTYKNFTGSLMSLSFQDDKLTSKHQIGLE